MSLSEWYSGREVLITGVTSVLGRAVLEKLFRSCPDVKVYVVLRTRDCYSPDKRVKNIFNSPGYERLRQDQPNAISRVTALEGNLIYDGLGLRKEDLAALRNVSVVLHAGGPHEAALEFCQKLPELCAVSAASSIFRHRGRITESLHNEYVPEIPLALVRLPALGPALREPMPGFVEVLRGATALMVGAGFALGRSDLPAEVLPVDLAANTLIASAWERAMRTESDRPTVYNVPSLGCTWGDLTKKGHNRCTNYAYPTFGIRGMTAQPWLYWFVVMLLEWFPSVLCDTILSIFGVKRRITEEYLRVRKELRSLEPILSRAWPSDRDQVNQLHDHLTPEDREIFFVRADIDIETYVLCAAAASRKYCVDGNNIKIIRAFRHFLLGLIVTVLLYVLFIR